MRSLRHIVAFSTVFLIVSSASAQKVRFNHVGKNKGLSQSSVNAIAQDGQGFLWFATEDGLNKYDGLEMEVFKDDPKGDSPEFLSDRSTRVLYTHDDGSLFIGTAYGGLNRRDHFNDTFEKFRYDSLDMRSLSSNTIHVILREDENHLWVGTEEGLNLLDLTTGECERWLAEDSRKKGHRVLPGDNILSLHKDVDGTLWVGTNDEGLLKMPPDRQRIIQHLPLDEEGALVSKYAKKVRAVHRDRLGTLWVGFDGAWLASFDGKESWKFYRMKSGDPYSIPSKRITCLFTDHKGVLWVGTGKGLSKYLPGRDGFITYRHSDDDPFSLPDDYVISIYEDAANSLWVGTLTGGITAYHRTLGMFNHFKSEKGVRFSLDNNMIFSFTEDNKGNIWAATVGGGLARINFDKEKIEHYTIGQNKTHDNVIKIYTSSTGTIWFGTWGGGFNYYNPIKGDFGEPHTEDDGLLSNTVLDFAEDEKGNLWIATFKGLNYYDIVNDTLYSYGKKFELKDPSGNKINMPGVFILNLYLDQSSNVLYAGTDEAGLYKIDLHDLTLDVYSSDDGFLSDDRVLALHHHEGILWVGTKKGLNRVDLSDMSSSQIHENDGLASDYINSILVDDRGYVWAATNAGISRFKPGAMDRVRNYSVEDGLQGNEFNQGAAFKTSTGELFFGGVNGLNHFYPEDITDNPHQPPVIVTSFKIFGKEYGLEQSISETDFIELSYKQNFFSFEFAALDFVLPEKNLYQYKMEGLDEDWSVSTNRPYASYTGLEGGEYTLRVRACNNDGVWSEEETTIRIVIIPPFWKTTTFYVAVSVAAVLLLFLIYRWRVRKIKREKRVLEEKVTERTKELAQKSEELAEKNKDIMDSINYAKKIQKAILPEDRAIQHGLRDSFVLYLPKDVVSGDFYWYGERGDIRVITAVDCTGHGVPGAFMSMIGSNLLSQIVLEKGVTDAGQILENLNVGVQKALKQGTDAQETNDGMDISLCTINTATLEVKWAGAYNPLYLIRGGEVQKFKADKYPIGGAHMELDRTYQTHTIQAEKDDALYMFSDGFVDQFGGPKGKKFMGKRFQRLLLDVHQQPMEEQREVLYKALKEWTGDLEQVDDVCVIGVRT